MRICLMTILLASLLCFAVPLAKAGEVWKITSLDWQPYSGGGMATQGNSIQKLRNLLQKRDITLVVEFYPWARAQEIAKRPGYVGYFPAWPEEIIKGFIASPPVDWSEIGVLTYRDSGLEWQGLKSLFQRKLGLVSTYKYPKHIQALATEHEEMVDSTPNEMCLLRKLSNRRFPAAITDPSVMLYLAEREGVGNIETLKVLGTHALVLAFQNTPENLQRLETLTELLKEESAAWGISPPGKSDNASRP